MTAQNHALTGAFIGLTVAHPALALPIAFLSHFVCDAIPHYDSEGGDTPTRLNSNRFVLEYLVLGAGLCFLLVLCLVITRPVHWLTAALCAFLATSPDLFWIPRFIHARRTGMDIDMTKANWFLRFHSAIQWKTGPNLVVLEAFWFGLFGSLVLARL